MTYYMAYMEKHWGAPTIKVYFAMEKRRHNVETCKFCKEVVGWKNLYTVGICRISPAKYLFAAMTLPHTDSKTCWNHRKSVVVTL